MKKFLFLILFLGIAVQGWCSTITFGGVAGNANDGTKWVGGVAPGAGDDVLLTATSAACTITASVTWNSLNCTGYTSTLTHNASVTLTLDGQDALGDTLILVSGMTYTLGNALTSAITFTGAGTSKITTGGKTLGNIIFNNSGDTFQLQDNFTTSGNFTNSAGTFDPQTFSVVMTGATPTITPTTAISFYNLTRTGNAVKTDTLVLAGNITVTNTLNIDGNSTINRVLVTSNTLGTARTLTLTGATVSGCTNVDFRDITFVGSPDFSAITGGSGDCGGNTGATFTTADDWYWNGSGTRNFSDYTYWYDATNGGGTQMAATLCPLPQDNCYIDGNSIDGATTIDQDMPRMCKTLDFTGCAAMSFHMNNIAQTIYGGITFTNNSTLTSGADKTTYFEGRGSFNFTKSTNVFSVNIYIQMVGGTLVLIDGIVALQATLVVNNGILDASTNNATVSGGQFSSTGSTVRGIAMGNNTWTFTGHAADDITVWNIGTTTNLTFNANSSTLSLTNESDSRKIFAGGGLAYNNISITGGGTTKGWTFTGSNTFNTFTINAPKTVKFTAGTTQKINKFVASGAANKKITLNSTSSLKATLKDAGGTNSLKHCNISNLTVNGGATWEAFTSNGNIDKGNNYGWIFNPGIAWNRMATSGAPATTNNVFGFMVGNATNNIFGLVN